MINISQRNTNGFSVPGNNLKTKVRVTAAGWTIETVKRQMAAKVREQRTTQCGKLPAW